MFVLTVLGVFLLSIFYLLLVIVCCFNYHKLETHLLSHHIVCYSTYSLRTDKTLCQFWELSPFLQQHTLFNLKTFFFHLFLPTINYVHTRKQMVIICILIYLEGIQHSLWQKVKVNWRSTDFLKLHGLFLVSCFRKIS